MRPLPPVSGCGASRLGILPALHPAAFSPEQPLSDLCSECGLCCNGTLYTYVTLVPDDMPRLEKYPQLRFIERNHQQTFDEGCVLHTGTGCGAYEDRPDTCRRYACGVLRAVAADELTEHEALQIIREARALVDNVKEYVEFEPGQPMAVSTWESPPPDIDDDARLAWERTLRFLGRHFLGNPPAA